MRAQRVQLKYNPLAEWVPPSKTENEDSKNFIISTLFIICLLTFALILSFTSLETLSKTQSADALSIKLNFASTTLGALTGGIITIVTTIMIIRKSFKVDYHSERISALPIFNICLTHDSNATLYNYCELTKEGKKIIKKDDVLAYGYGQLKQVLKVTNTGNGPAFRICTSGNFKSHEEICLDSLSTNNYKYIVTDTTHMHGITLEFYDVYENFYRQEFKICSNENKKYLIAKPPILVRRTDRVRYQQ